MCLGIPGQLVEMLEEHEHLARVDVAGVGRIINVGLLEDERLEPGDWVLIHVGFAMSKIDEAEAEMALALELHMGAAFTDEIAAISSSRITTEWSGRSIAAWNDGGRPMGAMVGLVIGYVLGNACRRQGLRGAAQTRGRRSRARTRCGTC